MTEAEWRACDDPRRLLECHQKRWTDRQARLFVVACCRATVPPLTDPRSLRAVEVAEAYADGGATVEELRATRAIAGEAEAQVPVGLFMGWGTPAWNEHQRRVWPFRVAADAARLWMGATPNRALELDIPSPVLVALVHCIFGNPFRPTSLDPAWRTSTVLALSKSIYDEKAFDRMPILADALQDAGCEDSDVLNHCRHDPSHARGCWVIDMIHGTA